MAIYTMRTTSGREDIVIDLLESKIKAGGLDIKSVFHPAEIKGYVFIEGSLGAVQKAVQGMMHIRGLIEKPVMMEEIKHFLEYTKTRIKVDVGDTVEIIGGPFKGERGKINRIDSVKGEVTIELLEASVPIPVTIATEFVKIIKKEGPAKREEEIAEEKPKQEVGLPEAGMIAESAAEREAGKKPEAAEEEKPEPKKKKLSLDDLKRGLGGEEPEAKPEPAKEKEQPAMEDSTSILEELAKEEEKKKKKKAAGSEEPGELEA
jgi:transcriptional antiterminator NusG